MRTRHLAAALSLTAVIPALSHADVPRTIAFQGSLNSPAGAPMPDGSYSITFRLYDSAVDGTLLWTEPGKPVVVAGGKGLFTAILGTPTPFGALAFDQPYFLELQAPGDNPMTPRLALQSSPYALNTPVASLVLPFSGSISTPGSTAITVQNTGGSGIHSTTFGGRALWGTCAGGSYAGYFENTGDGIGVNATSVSGTAVGGTSQTGYGSAGLSSSNIGVYGRGGTSSFGVYADASNGGSALRGVSVSGRALWATCSGASYGAFIENTGNGIGANVLAKSGIAVIGNSDTNYGVYGVSNSTIGVLGESASYEGVRGVGHDVNHGAGVFINTSAGAGVYAVSQGGGLAGQFDGRVRVAVLEITGGSDLAEKFDVSENAEPGTVMAIDPDHPGQLCVSRSAYNSAVAGVISGANKLSAGIVLPDASSSEVTRPLAMSGRVWVKCDASTGAIKPGDLLTTSSTQGHAMKATDHALSQGATLGKAMTGLTEGQGLVLALVSLQ